MTLLAEPIQILLPRIRRGHDLSGRFTSVRRDTSMDVWRIRALLVEALERHQFVRSMDCRPVNVPLATVREVFTEAWLRQVSPAVWEPGHGTYDWLAYWVHGVIR